ncbi:helix-turn-helix transcriptional regulator, partial [Streptomyces sp. SID3343]
MSGDESRGVPGRDAVEPDAARYGAAIQACFARAGVAQREFARKAFVDASAVTRYFKGQRVAP